jgi:DNA-binding NarL/FixJ family response regulator
MRVLLVDDELLALERLRTFFADIEDTEVVGQARDGDEALEEIERLRPDLVFFDIQMPGKTGLRAAADMKVEPRPEIVFVTAHEHYAPDAFEVDAADYLLKPVRFERLRHAVERARRRRSLRDAAERAGELEQKLAEAAATQATPQQDGFWIPERNGRRWVPIESIDWIELCAGGEGRAGLRLKPLAALMRGPEHQRPVATRRRGPRAEQTLGKPRGMWLRHGGTPAGPVENGRVVHFQNTCTLKRRRAYGSSGIEVAAVTSIVLTNRAATIVEKVRKVSAFMILTP